MKTYCLKIENKANRIHERYEKFEDVGEAAKFTAWLIRRDHEITKVNLFECTDESMPKVRQVKIATFYEYK